MKAHQPQHVEQALRKIGSAELIQRPQPPVAYVSPRFVHGVCAVGDGGVVQHVDLDAALIADGGPLEPARVGRPIHFFGDRAWIKPGEGCELTEVEIQGISVVVIASGPALLRYQAIDDVGESHLGGAALKPGARDGIAEIR
jgi:hypothetical protein